MTQKANSASSFSERLHRVMLRFVPESAKQNTAEYVKRNERRFLSLWRDDMRSTVAMKSVRQAGARASSLAFSTMPYRQALKALRSQNTAYDRLDNDDFQAWATNVVRLETFGECLIAAAKQSLPVDARMLAYQFRAELDADRRLAMLPDVLNALSIKRWQENFPILAKEEDRARAAAMRGEDDRVYSPWMVLPHVFGRFPDSPLRPNCLGAALMAAAWCELAGVPYMYGSLIAIDADYHWQRYGQAARRQVAFCDARGIELPPDVRYDYQADIKTADEYASISNQAGDRDPHAMVVLELAPGENWAVLDPWQQKCYELPEFGRQAHGELDVVSAGQAYTTLERFKSVAPGMTLIHRQWQLDHCWEEVDSDLEDSFEVVQALRSAQEKYEGLPIVNDSFHLYLWALAGVLAKHDFHSRYLDEWLQSETSLKMGDRHFTPDPITAQLVHLQMILCDYWTSRRDDVDYVALMEMVHERYGRDTRFAQRIRNDVVSGLLHQSTQFGATTLNHFIQDKMRPHYPHVAVEYGRPNIQFACATLAHLYAWDDWTAGQLKVEELLPYSTSQLLAVDAVADIEHRSEELTLPQVVVFETEQFLADRVSPTVQTFAHWLVQDGQPGANSVEWPSYLHLDDEVGEEVLKAWQHLNATPPALQHVLTRRLIQRIKASAQAKSPQSQPEEVEHGQAETGQGNGRADRSLAR